MNRQTLKKYKENYRELREILNEWDFLEVKSEGIENEYEDLINPILNLLYKQPSREELAEVIDKFVTDNYGLQASKSNLENAEQILKWWNNNQNKN